MKSNKVLVLIIIVLLIIIAVIGTMFFMYVKNNEKEITNNVSNQVSMENKIDNTNKQENVVQNKVEDTTPEQDNNAIKDPNKFRGKDKSYYEEIVRKYIRSNYEYEPTRIMCDYTQTGNFVATVSTQYEVANEYIFDPETGYGEESDTGIIIDFENNKVVEQYSNIPFGYNDLISIGYVLDDLVAQYKENYFFDTTYKFEDIENIDLRLYDKDSGNRFYIIPKNHNVKVSIYMVNNDGVKDVLLRDEIDKPIVLYTDYVEYVPKHIIEFEYTDYAQNKVKGEFEISFNGYDGKLNIPKNPMWGIHDSSLYSF